MSLNVNETQAPAIQFVESLSDIEMLSAMALCVVLIAIIAVWPSKAATPPKTIADEVKEALQRQSNET